MRLYLVQHGEAVAKEENPERPLSAKGRADVERMAAFLARGCPPIARVIHSRKMRAVDTARLLAKVLAPDCRLEEAVNGLSPNDATNLIADAAPEWDHDTLLVGHLPHIAKLASRLITGSDEAAVADFKPGAVACLERTENGDGWSLAWLVRPELLGT